MHPYRPFRRLLLPLLPLVFHPLTSMRRAGARLLAIATFGPAACCWSDFPHRAATLAAGRSAMGRQGQPVGVAAGDRAGVGPGAGVGVRTAAHTEFSLVPPGVGAVLLPEPFVHAHKFPFRVVGVSPDTQPEEEGRPGLDQSGAGARSEASPGRGASPAAAAAAPMQQKQAGGSRGGGSGAATHLLVAQQRLMRAAGGDPAAARRLLDSPPPGLDLPQPLLHAMASTLAHLDASVLAPAALAAVGGAASHAACARALRGLRRLVSNGPGMGGVLGAAWGEALGRLLGAAPVTEEDQGLWLELLPVVERMLAGGPWQQVGEGGRWRGGLDAGGARCL